MFDTVQPTAPNPAVRVIEQHGNSKYPNAVNGSTERGAARILRAPLAIKILGANAMIAVVVWSVAYYGHGGTPSMRMMVELAAALISGLAINTVLVVFALRPIRELEATVSRIWRGEPAARVSRSPIGDPQLDRVGGTLNALLDNLDQDRVRMHGLATEVIRAEDRERARIGRELHDSIAQALAAVAYQLSAAEKDARDPATAGRLRAIRVLAGQVLDEVDVLSHTVHPRVLNDLGLLAGLRHLARTVADPDQKIEVVASDGTDDAFCGIGMDTAAVMYRVAQDALQNAKRHSNARSIQIILGATDNDISMDVVDDGTGFDVAEAKARRPGMGLFTMSERVSLVHGEFAIDSAPGKGTTVRVRIPVERSTLQTTAGSVS